ncbi:MAG: hypothetical protein J6C85_08410 [Alphaproteobacteria bacterium]|nr:hypothetical protein [Alphaproteobacteria bacterium]MBP3515861.1 hypothetical protein [Alphaproteobacteria bacterium]
MTKKINSDQQKTSIIPNDFLEAADYKYKTEGISYEYSLYEYAQKYKKIKLSKEQELSFHRLIKRVEERLLPEQRRTNAINAQMMHEIVKAIGRKKHVTDLAAGLGGIIWQLDYVNCIQDINQNFLDVAELIAYQKGNTVISVHSADSIKEALPFDGKGIFLFDPPMGQNRIKPDEWKQFNASSKAGIGRAGSGKTGDKTVSLFEILGENLKDTPSLSENLFIINFLLRAADDAYFICLVPETFLTKNENEYNNLRAYLIKNSLLAVIKPPASSGINTVVLYGQKKRKKDNQVKLITTKKYDYQEIIDYIFEDKEIKSEDIKSDVLNPTEITEPYLIKMPVIVGSKGYVYIPSEKVIGAIIENENLLNEKKKPFISKEILHHKIFVEENKKEIKEDTKVWWGNAKEPQKLREELKNQDYSDFQLCIQLFSSLGCFRKEEAKQEFDISLFNTFIDMSCFCTLLAYGIVRKEENKYIIDTRKPEQQNFTLEADDIKKAYDIYLKPDKKGEAFVLLAYTDEFVKKIYFDLCRYYISGKDQNSTEIYSSKRADILRALKILEKLGLVRTQTTNDQFIYSHYVPRYYFEGKWIYD